MKQYLNLLQDIMRDGTWKNPARSCMPRTKELFGCMMKFDASDGFPLVTTKKMHTKGIVAELLWFLNGETNIQYLIKNGCNIWNDDAYKYYVRLCGDRTPPLSKEQFIDEIKCAQQIRYIKQPFNGVASFNNPELSKYRYGDCGNIYGHQWTKYCNWMNQLDLLIDNIKTNPDSRYHIVSAWNPTDFIGPYKNRAALPACHMMFQCSVRNDEYLDIIMNQRSCDTMLGVPYNVASYAILQHIIAKLTGYKPGVFTWVGNSVHIYENHIPMIEEQLSREPYKLCDLIIEDRGQKTYSDFLITDFTFNNYESWPSIKAPLSVGV